jgi:hypothetical protein
MAVEIKPVGSRSDLLVRGDQESADYFDGET